MVCHATVWPVAATVRSVVYTCEEFFVQIMLQDVEDIFQQLLYKF